MLFLISLSIYYLHLITRDKIIVHLVLNNLQYEHNLITLVLYYIINIYWIRYERFLVNSLTFSNVHFEILRCFHCNVCSLITYSKIVFCYKYVNR